MLVLVPVLVLFPIQGEGVGGEGWIVDTVGSLRVAVRSSRGLTMTGSECDP